MILFHLIADYSFLLERKKKIRDYDIRNLELAVEAVEHGILSSRKAANYYGVPRSSVVSRIYRKKHFNKTVNSQQETD